LITGVSLGILGYVLQFVDLRLCRIPGIGRSLTCSLTIGQFQSQYLVNIFNLFPGHALLSSLLTISRSPCRDMACFFAPLIPVPSTNINFGSDSSYIANNSKRPSELYMLVLQAIVYMLALAWKERRSGSGCGGGGGGAGGDVADHDNEDQDVREERRRVEQECDSGSPARSSHAISMCRLRKEYAPAIEPRHGCFSCCCCCCCCCCNRRSSGKLALHSQSLSVAPGECFGYLGINGAGKTTTLKILTGTVEATGGTATIAGSCVVRDRGAARQKTGYCPQFDALHDQVQRWFCCRPTIAKQVRERAVCVRVQPRLTSCRCFAWSDHS
jgi:ABC-type multidrug transport system fused ATPase/permease subunit